MNALWQWAGPRWFPRGRELLPSLVDPDLKIPATKPETGVTDSSAALSASRHWR